MKLKIKIGESEIETILFKLLIIIFFLKIK